ncbi:MAG: LapA family protein [Candidatus Cloacimonadota bacterium]|nr:MAG: LapA family protein [Candidatus Cloacimonadota bacterium]
MVLFILLWAAIFTIIGIIIGTQNAATIVNVSLLTWTFNNIPLTLVLIETFAIGVIFTIIVAVIDEIRLKSRLWRTNNELRELKKELTSLRNLPVEEIVEDKSTEKAKEEIKESEGKEKKESK